MGADLCYLTDNLSEQAVLLAGVTEEFSFEVLQSFYKGF